VVVAEQLTVPVDLVAVVQQQQRQVTPARSTLAAAAAADSLRAPAALVALAVAGSS
jgi:hypothetical protein